MDNDVPKGLKVISYIYYIIGILMFIAGVWGIIWSLSSLPHAGLAAFIIIPILVVSVILSFSSVLYFFVGRGLTRKQNWSRIVAIVLSVLIVGGGIDAIISTFFGNYTPIFSGNNFYIFLSFIFFIINIIVLIYLIFNNSVNNFFSKIDSKRKISNTNKYAIIVLVILLIFSYSSFQKNSSFQEQFEIPQELKHLEKDLPPDINECKDFDIKRGLTLVSPRDTCYYDKAIEFMNPKICSKINSGFYVKQCYDALRVRL